MQREFVYVLFYYDGESAKKEYHLKGVFTDFDELLDGVNYLIGEGIMGFTKYQEIDNLSDLNYILINGHADIINVNQIQ